jgi:uncharacterized protein (DUF1684 family)
MGEVEPALDETMGLLDWRRRIAELYADVRAESDPERAWQLWRDTRGNLFSTHPQSPIPRSQGREPRYFDHDPHLRVLGGVVPAPSEEIDLPGSRSESHRARRFGTVEFELAGHPCRLDLFWLTGYAGGLFLPFRDATSGRETYGAGRYLLDTAKGADLGGDADALVLDFNFAYQPSCAYDPRWSCPLTPPRNRLSLAVLAGERL